MSTNMCSPNRKLLQFTSIFSIALLGLLGHTDTAKAQGQDSLLVSPSTYTFSSPLGGGPQNTTIQVTSSAAALNYTIAYQSAANWFVAVPSGVITPGSVTIYATPGQLGVGTYPGTITLTPSGAGTTPVVINVSLNIVPPTSISVSPSSLSFTATAGTSTPTAAQSISVNSGTNNIPYTASVTYTQPNLPTWLQVTPLNGQVTNSSVSVTANPNGLPGGTYTAAITFTSGQNSTQVVNVTFTVNAVPMLTTNLASIPFYYQIGQSTTFDSSAVLNIGTSTNAVVPINVTLTSANCPGIFGVSQQGALSTPASLQVYASSLGNFTSSQTCSGSLAIASTTTSNTLITIPITLTVSTSPLVVITPTLASFTYQVGSTLPANQNLTISSTTTGIQFTASSNQPWLAVTPSGVTSANSQITLNLVAAQLAGLIPNTYQATVTVNAVGAANSPITIPVTLTVGANTLLTFSPPFANFVYEIGQQGGINTQQIQVGTTGGQIPFTIALPTTTGNQFVTFTPTSGVAPTTVTVSVNPSGLSAGTYTQALQFTPSNPSQNQAPQSVPVNLSVSNTGQAQLNASPQTLTFNYASGQGLNSIASQTIALTGTDQFSPLNITNVTVNSSWLLASCTTTCGQTPYNLLVNISPTFLTPSATPYTSSLTISATNQQGLTSTATIQVTLNYTSGVTLTASPVSLSFAQLSNGAAPAAQTVSIGASGNTGANLAFSTTASTVSGGSWLTVSPATGTAPAAISISVNSLAATLTPGTYSGSVVVFGQGASNPNGTLTIPVTLTVTAAPTLTANPVGLTFSGTVAGANPSAQQLQLSSPGAVAPVSFTVAVSTTSGGNWLTVTPTSASTGTPLSVSVNLAGLAPGSYSGTITLTPSGGGAALTVPVSFTVAAQATPVITTIINSASGATGSISPGEIVTIFGTGVGPLGTAGLTLTAQGTVATTLAGVQVTFNGIAAPLTYVSPTQINCVVPYEVASASTAQIQVSYNGIVSAATAVGIVATTPGIFTQNSSGTGAGAILQPNYSAVSPSNPAPRGSTIIIYATGGGVTNPASTTGAVAGATLLKTAGNVTVTIGGISSTIAYAGSAPGLVEGVLQINAIVPTTIAAGTQPILVTVGNNTSQNGVTVTVQ